MRQADVAPGLFQKNPVHILQRCILMCKTVRFLFIEFVNGLGPGFYMIIFGMYRLTTAAYTTEILRGAIESTPHGEVGAARACGMGDGLMYRRIVLPSAFRRALPAYGNECVFMLHGSAVASTVTLLDLTGVANIVNARYYSPYEAYSMAALFYMALTFAIVAGFILLERRMLRHLRPRSA